jgi:hypothetical protein
MAGVFPGAAATVVSALLVILAAAANLVLEGGPVHAWLAWPWWAQAVSAIAVATLFIALDGAVTGLVFYFLFAACFLFVRGPAPAYQVVPEFLPPSSGQQERQ